MADFVQASHIFAVPTRGRYSGPRCLSHSYSKGKDAAMSEMQQGAWTKPAAMAIPKGGYLKDKVEQGDTARSFPRLRPATASRSSQS